MKAITVTQELKDLNIKLFKNFSVGSIRKINIPNSFFSPTHHNGQRTDGYHTLSNSIHEADGFYDIVTPISGVDYDDAIEKLGAIEWDAQNSVFIFSIIALTQQEQDDYAQQLEDNDQYGTKQQTRESDGHIMVLRFFAMIHRKVGNNNLTANRAAKVSNYMLTGLTFLNLGEMEISKNSFNNIDISSETAANQTAIQAIIDLGIEKVQDYLDNE